jgi:uncharacterized membrane protein
MRENVGDRDRAMRWVAGPALMGLGLTVLGARTGRPLGIAATVAGALVVESAITRVCPVNAALGIDSRDWDRRTPARRLRA